MGNSLYYTLMALIITSFGIMVAFFWSQLQSLKEEIMEKAKAILKHFQIDNGNYLKHFNKLSKLASEESWELFCSYGKQNRPNIGRKSFENQLEKLEEKTSREELIIKNFRCLLFITVGWIVFSLFLLLTPELKLYYLIMGISLSEVGFFTGIGCLIGYFIFIDRVLRHSKIPWKKTHLIILIIISIIVAGAIVTYHRHYVNRQKKAPYHQQKANEYTKAGDYYRAI